MPEKKESFKFERNAFSVISVTESDDETDYWRMQAPEDRILAIEFLRQLMYGYDAATERLQRVFETAEFKTN